MANVGNLISANKLRSILGIKTSATVLDYLSYFEQAYIIELVAKFSYSQKVQSVNPKKIYFIDTGLQLPISPSPNPDLGRRFENLVFLDLARYYKEIFYFNEKNKECDFVVCKNSQPRFVVQVCVNLDAENRDKEIQGLLEAMNFFNLAKGYIITANQSDKILTGDKEILIQPFYQTDFKNDFV